MLAVIAQHGLRFPAVGIAAGPGFRETVRGLPLAGGQLRDVLLLLLLGAVIEDRQRANACMCRDGHAETMTRPGHFRQEHRGHEVLAEAAELLRHRDAQQTKLAGFFQQALHQTFLHAIDAVQVRPNLLRQEVPRRLRDHALLLIEFLGDENVLRVAFADQEFAALKGFGFGLGRHCSVRMFRPLMSAANCNEMRYALVRIKVCMHTIFCKYWEGMPETPIVSRGTAR